jgi:hypothetical protein
MTTPANRIHLKLLARVLDSVQYVLIFGIAGVLFLVIPPVGLFLLLCALLAPVYCIVKADSCDQLFGACPHCSRELKVKWLKARKGGFNCKFCKRRVVLQGVEGDEKFLAV